MPNVIRFPSQGKSNKRGPRDRAAELADSLLKISFAHVVEHWDDKAGNFAIGALHRKLAAVLRIEIAHGGRGA